jgi:hypothetical protein
MIDNTNQYEMFLTIGNNRVFEYYHNDKNVYIEGREKSKYSVNLVNKSHERVMAVVSVDGMNIINGKPEWDDGYIINPYASLKIDGWLVNNKTMAAFEFSNLENSYSNKINGVTSNVGVIGCMFFREKPNNYHFVASSTNLSHTPIYGGTSSTPYWNMAVSSNQVKSSEPVLRSLGTKFGEDIETNVSEVKFERRDKDNSDATLVLYYDSKKGLEKRGINLHGSPDPFPGYTTGSGRYCQRP